MMYRKNNISLYIYTCEYGDIFIKHCGMLGYFLKKCISILKKSI